MSSKSFVNERLALAAVEPAVAHLTTPLLPLHGPETTSAVSQALVSLLLPSVQSSSHPSAPSDIYTDTLGQICVQLAPFGEPLVVWPIALGLTRAKDAPQPSLRSEHVNASSSRHERAQQISRTRLLVRSLVLQAAIDLEAIAKTVKPDISTMTSSHASTSRSSNAPKLTLDIPAPDSIQTMSPVEIIRTAVPLELPSPTWSSASAAFPFDLVQLQSMEQHGSSTPSSGAPSLTTGSTSPTNSSWSHGTIEQHDSAPSSAVPSLIANSTSPASSSWSRDRWSMVSPVLAKNPAIAALEPMLFSPVYLGDFTFETTEKNLTEVVPRSESQEQPSWWRERSARWGS